MRQEFTIWGTLDGLNEYTAALKSHRMSGQKMKRDNQTVVGWAIRGAGLRPMRSPVRVSFLWVEGMRPGRKVFRPRDRDNIGFARKFILDALVECGIIRDDSFSDVEIGGERFMLNRNDPKIVVVIEEV